MLVYEPNQPKINMLLMIAINIVANFCKLKYKKNWKNCTKIELKSGLNSVLSCDNFTKPQNCVDLDHGWSNILF